MANLDKPWHEVSEYANINWSELEGAKIQIMRQAAMFGVLGVAWHCIMFHEPMIQLDGDTIRIYSMTDDLECGVYTKVDITFTQEEIDDLDGMTIGPSNVFNWVMTAMMDPDNSKQMNYPAVIEGSKIRVEIG